jgi:multiple sugar transport system substrate-binding protein
MMLSLRGMTWDHERGIAPLLRASSDFKQLNKHVSIEWDARSLADFEHYPLELLADRYDFIMIDHPHLGAAAALGLLTPLNEILPCSFLDEQRANSVGQSYASYFWQGNQWALAVDAAAQVSAFRPDMLESVGLAVPQTWEEVLALASALPTNVRIGLPLLPVHAFASYFTLTSQLGGEAFWSQENDIPLGIAVEALQLLRELLKRSHPQSVHSDPISMYELMATTDSVAYVPLIYGYSNYSRHGFRANSVHCADIPSSTGKHEGSMIGGVGLAISSKCRYPELAAEFAMITASGDYQRSGYFMSGGQPGHRSAWEDERVNEQANGFFANTLRTLDLGTVRPRFNGYIAFQEKAGILIRECLIDVGMDLKSAGVQLNRMLMNSRLEKGD